MYENSQVGAQDSTALPDAAATASKVSSKQSSDAALLLGGAAGLALGSLLPWETVTVPLLGTITANGLQAGGLFTLASAALIFVLARRVRREALARRAALGVFAAVGIALLTVVVKFAVVMSDAAKARGVAAVSAGSGLYICAAAAVAIAVGGVRQYRESRRDVGQDAATWSGGLR